MNPQASIEPFEALWLNVNGINSNKTDSNFYLLLRLFVKSKYSILFLQEPRLREGSAGAFEKGLKIGSPKVIQN